MKVLICELRRLRMGKRSNVYHKTTRGSVTGLRVHSLPIMPASDLRCPIQALGALVNLKVL